MRIKKVYQIESYDEKGKAILPAINEIDALILDPIGLKPLKDHLIGFAGCRTDSMNKIVYDKSIVINNDFDADTGNTTFKTIASRRLEIARKLWATREAIDIQQAQEILDARKHTLKKFK